MNDLEIPDVAESLLGFRVWRYRDEDLSLWSVTTGDKENASRVEMMLENSTPDGYWPKRNSEHGSVLEAKCSLHPNDEGHYPPDSECTCGIYATYDLNTIARYIKSAPVLGLVQGYGQAIPGIADGTTHGGFRAQKAKIVCIFAISDDFTISQRELRKLGREYDVPVVRPWSTSVIDYANAVRNGTLEQLGELKV